MNILKNHRMLKLFLVAVCLMLVPVFLYNGVLSAVTPTPGAPDEGITSGSDLKTPGPADAPGTHQGFAYIFTKDGVNVIDIRYNTIKALWGGIPRSAWPDNVDHEDKKIIWAQIGKPDLDEDGKYRGIYALDTQSMTILTKVITGSESGNWVVQGTDGRYVYGAARDPANKYLQIGADPTQSDFGQVVDSVTIPGGNIKPGQGVPGPCDAAITSNGFYIFEPDIWGDTMTRIDTAAAPGGFGVGPQYPMVLLDPAVRVEPFMTTVSPDDQYVLQENLEGGDGTESVFDISDPNDPKEVVRFVQDSRLAALAITYPGLTFTGSSGETVTIKGGLGQKNRSNEFTKDGFYSLIINSKTNDVNVVNMSTLTIDCSVSFPLPAPSNNYVADTGDWSVDGKLFLVNLERTNEVGVIAYDDSAATCATKFTYLKTIALHGTKPQGIVVRQVNANK